MDLLDKVLLAIYREWKRVGGLVPPPSSVGRLLGHADGSTAREAYRELLDRGYLRQPWPRWAYLLTDRGLNRAEALAELKRERSD